MILHVRALPTYDEATRLPGAPGRRVPEEYGDANCHLNVRHYLGILDDAEWVLFDRFGAGSEAAAAGTGGMFALEQQLSYRREVLVGDEVAVHLRLLARESRMLHLVSYLVNHTRLEVAASMESLEAFVDHRTRRMAPFPADTALRLDELLAGDRALPWQPELSGSIGLPGAPS